jgi:hypothetical protein
MIKYPGRKWLREENIDFSSQCSPSCEEVMATWARDSWSHHIHWYVIARQLVTSYPLWRAERNEWILGFLLACWCSPWFLQTFTVPDEPREWHCPRCGMPSHTNLLKTTFTSMPTGQPTLDTPSLRLSFQLILGCVKLTTQVNYLIE